MTRKTPRKKAGAGKPAAKKPFPTGLLAFAIAAVLLGGGAWWAVSESDPANAAPGEVIVYKSPTCGCCAEWVDHMEAAGFKVTVNHTEDLNSIKREYGVPYGMDSCHTAIVDGYVVEGHVPAADVKRFLTGKPRAAGIAVPGMPVGSPGMEQGSYREPYEVVQFGPSGTKVFARH